jgi:hypothetical protein
MGFQICTATRQFEISSELGYPAPMAGIESDGKDIQSCFLAVWARIHASCFHESSGTAPKAVKTTLKWQDAHKSNVWH